MARGQHKVLGAHLSVANNALILGEVAREHGFCQHEQVPLLHALGQEGVLQEVDEALFVRLGLGVHRWDELSHDLPLAFEGLVEDRAALSFQVGGVGARSRRRLIKDAIVKFATNDFGQRVPEVVHRVEVNFLVNALSDGSDEGPLVCSLRLQ